MEYILSRLGVAKAQFIPGTGFTRLGAYPPMTSDTNPAALEEYPNFVSRGTVLP